jgi:hypothetical protein
LRIERDLRTLIFFLVDLFPLVVPLPFQSSSSWWLLAIPALSEASGKVALFLVCWFDDEKLAEGK